LGNKGRYVFPSFAKRGKGRFYKNIFSFCIIFFPLFIFLFSRYSHAETKPIGINARFPDLTFENILSKDEQAYLGISGKKYFSFKEINGSLIVVELTNAYCVSCKKNIPILNEIYQRIQKDLELKDKVKVIGIAIGNNMTEVESLRNENKFLYPLLTDPKFSAHKALGEPRVPYTMFIRRDARGKYIIFKIHKGVIESADSLMNEIRIICSKHFQKYAF